MSEPLNENGPVAPAPPPAPEASEPEVEYAQIPRSEYDELRAQLERLAPLAEQYDQWQQQEQQVPQQQAQPVQLDPFADDFQSQLDQYLDQRIAPVQQFTEQQQLQAMEEQARDIAADYAAQKGYDFLDENALELALVRANSYVYEEAERYGSGTMKAVEAAIGRAVDEMHEYEQTVGQKYAEQQMNQVRTLSSAPRQPSQQAAPQALPSIAAPTGGPQAVVDKYFPRGY